MNWCNVLFQVTFLCKDWWTNITIKYFSFMNWFNMLFEVTICLKNSTTSITMDFFFFASIAFFFLFKFCLDFLDIFWSCHVLKVPVFLFYHRLSDFEWLVLWISLQYLVLFTKLKEVFALYGIVAQKIVNDW